MTSIQVFNHKAIQSQPSSVTLNENFKFTRPATVTGAYLPSSGDLFFHQMTLDRVENGDYILQNSDFADHSPGKKLFCFQNEPLLVLRIPLKNPYYSDYGRVWHINPTSRIGGRNPTSLIRHFLSKCSSHKDTLLKLCTNTN